MRIGMHSPAAPGSRLEQGAVDSAVGKSVPVRGPDGELAGAGRVVSATVDTDGRGVTLDLELDEDAEAVLGPAVRLPPGSVSIRPRPFD